MKIKIPLPLAIAAVLFSLLITPVTGQIDVTDLTDLAERREIQSIESLLDRYETAFNNRDIDARMALCADTYYEYAFEFGRFLHARDYDEVRRESGNYWNSIMSLNYSIDNAEINVDGPLAYVRAETTHLASSDRHRSIVNFALVKINGQWWIAWDSYNIIRRYE